MSKVMTTDDLIRRVRLRGMVPSDTSTYTDEVIVEVLNDEMDSDVLAQILKLNEEHMVDYVDVDIIPSVTEYKIPERAIANKLRDLALMDSNGNFYETTRISLEEISDNNFDYESSNDLPKFYVQGDSVILFNAPLRNYTKLRMYFYMRPSKLVQNKESAKITSINFTTGVVSVDNLPNSYVALPKMDFIAYSSPNKIIDYDVPCISVNNSSNPRTITFNPNLIPKDLKVGDFVSVAQESPVPNIPTEWHPYLAQAAIVQILESLGDTQGLTNANNKLAKMFKDLSSITDNRVEGSPQKVRARHNHIRTRTNAISYRGR
jgi:hypothetical protein